jgi:hypothetical protein
MMYTALGVNSTRLTLDIFKQHTDGIIPLIILDQGLLYRLEFTTHLLTFLTVLTNFKFHIKSVFKFSLRCNSQVLLKELSYIQGVPK